MMMMMMISPLKNSKIDVLIHWTLKSIIFDDPPSYIIEYPLDELVNIMFVDKSCLTLINSFGVLLHACLHC